MSVSLNVGVFYFVNWAPNRKYVSVVLPAEIEMLLICYIFLLIV